MSFLKFEFEVSSCKVDDIYEGNHIKKGGIILCSLKKLFNNKKKNSSDGHDGIKHPT